MSTNKGSTMKRIRSRPLTHRSANSAAKVVAVTATMLIFIILCVQSTCTMAFVGPTVSTTSRALSKAAMRRSLSNPIPEMKRRQTQCYSASEEKRVLDQVIGGTDLPVPPATMVTADHVFENAIKNTILWVAAAGVFGAGLFFFYDTQAAEEFFAGYVLEQSLSVDNLLVFLLLFEYFQVPLAYQNRVLNWGIFGAMGMRAIMIGAGAVAIQQFHEVLLVFAAILIFSSGKVLIKDDDDEEEEDLSNNQIVQFATKIISSTDKFDGDRFFTIVEGVKKATPLFLCMVAVEISDVVFAIDSIPAVFGVTEDPLVVFSSNIFAIMGLRSLYTILSKAASELKYLEPAVAVVLGFIGTKMIAEYFGYIVPTEVSLGVVLTMLGTGVGASLWESRATTTE